MNHPKGVVVIDDHVMFTEAIELLLEGEEDIRFLGAASSGSAGIALCRVEGPDVVIVDIDLPDMDGVDVLRTIRSDLPGTRTIVVTALPVSEAVRQARAAGADGIVAKSRTAEELIAAVRGLALEQTDEAGERSSALEDGGDRGLRSSLHETNPHPLTHRETEVLTAIAKGMTTQAVATVLFISPLTVRSHVKSILHKLDAHSKLEAVTIALQQGLIRLSPVEESSMSWRRMASIRPIRITSKD
jgi:DNA-binding NarL/FixJ family response regulator